MTTTTYYNMNIVEGTDIVNPLTVDNPNYEKIDKVMHDNAVSGVTFATEIANATVHAITRENSECAAIRFIATSNWKAGDTVTVDGVPVTALLPSGETLPDGAYVINANVLCILTGTNLTVYAERKKTDNANDIAYKNTTVAAELTKLNSNLTELQSVDITPVSNNYAAVITSASYAYIKNGICYLQIAINGTASYSGWVKIAKLPIHLDVGGKELLFPAIDTSAQKAHSVVRVTSDGGVYCTPESGATLYANVSFPCY